MYLKGSFSYFRRTNSNGIPVLPDVISSGRGVYIEFKNTGRSASAYKGFTIMFTTGRFEGQYSCI